MKNKLEIGDKLYLSIFGMNLHFGEFEVVSINKKGNATLKYSQDDFWKPILKADCSEGIIEIANKIKHYGEWNFGTPEIIENVTRKNILEVFEAHCDEDDLLYNFMNALTTDQLIRIKKILDEGK